MPDHHLARLGAAVALAAALAACSHTPRPATPAPQPTPRPRALQPQPAPPPAQVPVPAAAPAPAAPAPAAAPARFELAGEWDWSAMLQDQPYSGILTLRLQGGAWSGVMNVSGQFDATVRTAAVTGDAVRISFDSPQGEMTLDAVFTDANTLAGRVEVHSMEAVASFSAHRK